MLRSVGGETIIAMIEAFQRYQECMVATTHVRCYASIRSPTAQVEDQFPFNHRPTDLIRKRRGGNKIRSMDDHF